MFSVCSLLYKLGFKVPKDVVLYANRVSEYSANPSNAYLLASAMSGKQIFKLCEELNATGQNLRDASLTDEQINRYHVLREKKKREARIKKCKERTTLYRVGNKTVSVYRGSDPMATKLAFLRGVDYAIRIKEIGDTSEEKEKSTPSVNFSITANSEKEDLPPEVLLWAYKLKNEALTGRRVKYFDDIVVDKTQVIYGNDKKPNVKLKGKARKDLNDLILAQISKSEARNLSTDLVNIGTKQISLDSMLSELDTICKEEREYD